MKKTMILLIAIVIPAFTESAQKQTKPGPIEVYARYDKKKDVTSVPLAKILGRRAGEKGDDDGDGSKL